MKKTPTISSVSLTVVFSDGRRVRARSDGLRNQPRSFVELLEHVAVKLREFPDLGVSLHIKPKVR